MLGVVLLPIARAVAKRIGGGASDHALMNEIQGLRDDVDAMRAELADNNRRLGQLDDMQSRLDFAERVIAQGKDRNALPGAR